MKCSNCRLQENNIKCLNCFLKNLKLDSFCIKDWDSRDPSEILPPEKMVWQMMKKFPKFNTNHYRKKFKQRYRELFAGQYHFQIYLQQKKFRLELEKSLKYGEIFMFLDWAENVKRDLKKTTTEGTERNLKI